MQKSLARLEAERLLDVAKIEYEKEMAHIRIKEEKLKMNAERIKIKRKLAMQAFRDFDRAEKQAEIERESAEREKRQRAAEEFNAKFDAQMAARAAAKTKSMRDRIDWAEVSTPKHDRP